MQNNKNGGFWVIFISLLISNFIEDIIYRSFGLVKYNMFSDGFYAKKLIFELFIYAISFVPVFYLVKLITNKFAR